MSKEINEDDIRRLVNKNIGETKGISRNQSIMSKEISDDDVRRLGNKGEREMIRIPIPKQAFAEDTPSPSYHHKNLRYDPESETFIQDDYEQESILENINKEIRIIRDEQRSLVDEYHRQNRLLFIIAILPILYVAILLIMMFTAK